MKPIGLPIRRYQVKSKNENNLPIGSEILAFSKGNYYSGETIVRDNRFEIRIYDEIINFSEIEKHLIQLEDYL